MIIVIIVWYINNLKFVFKVMKIREHGENDVTVEPIRPTFINTSMQPRGGLRGTQVRVW